MNLSKLTPYTKSNKIKILYISGCVPVQLNAGFMLMYRHLARFSKNHKVFIITDDNPKAKHLVLPSRGIRLPDQSKSILRRIMAKVGFEVFWFFFEAKNIKNKIKNIIKFKPDLILSVWDGPFLFAASDLSKEFKIPLVLFIHDDWQKMINKNNLFLNKIEKRLKEVFQIAAARLCVSQGLVNVFKQRYGRKKCQILFPIPGKIGADIKKPRRLLKPLRIGFFGELGGNFDVLECLANVLLSTNSTLTFFSHGKSLRRQQLALRDRVADGGELSATNLYIYFVKNIDVIVIPQGFDKESSILRKTCFPSKIPEACRFGLPLLIIGPNYGSAYQWAKKKIPEKCLITELNPDKIASGIKYLKIKNNWVKAQKCIKKVADMFEPEKLHETLDKTIAKTVKHGTYKAFKSFLS